MWVLVLAQYFSPDMGGGSTRAYDVVKGLLGRGCEVKVEAAFQHYPHGNVPARYLMQVTNTLELSAVVWREDGVYVALCPF
jgi:hypothetical protein